MATSRFGAVIDALVTLARTTTVEQVFDGPPNGDDALTEYLIVGGTDDPDDDAGEFDQDWAGLGKASRNEQGQVTVSVLVGTGDDTVKTARDRALVILGQVENALRADPSLGGVITSGWSQMMSGRPRQRRTNEGLYVRITTTVAYNARV